MAEQQIKKTTVRLVAAAVAMFGFGYALVPLYEVICDVTGINGKSSGLQEVAATVPTDVDRTRTVTVELVGTPNSELPWEFHPITKEIDVNPGQVTEVYYHARNLTDREITGQAVPSVAPGSAARHFDKIECFCFTKQTLKGNEAKPMLVQFRVDPKLDPSIERLTLSYTFYALAADGSVKQPAGTPIEMDHSQHGGHAGG